MHPMNGLKALSFLAERGVEVALLSETTFYVCGFYKSGGVNVNIETNTITARYNEVTEVSEWSDLVDTLISVNLDWFERSRDRSEGWSKMDEAWAAVQRDYEMMVQND
jgi:hypothetical protein